MPPPDLFAPRRRATFVTEGKRYSRSKRFDERHARTETSSALAATTSPVATIAIFQGSGIGFDRTLCAGANSLATSGGGVSVCASDVDANKINKIDNNSVVGADCLMPLIFQYSPAAIDSRELARDLSSIALTRSRM